MGGKLAMPSLLDVKQPLVGTLKPNPAALVWQLYLNLQGNIPLTVQIQQETYWCWAAVSVSVALYYNASAGWTQCGMAEAEMKQDSCCKKGSSDECNQFWWLEVALQRTGNLAEIVNNAIDFKDVKTEIDDKLAICSRIGWNAGGGHYVGIKGYQELGATQWLTICDPNCGVSNQSFPIFENSYQGKGRWTHTFRTHG
jgi:hypothetical protein